MLHAEIETRISEIVALALHMPAQDALKVYRMLRQASDELLHIIAAAPTPPPPAPAEVVPIRPGAQIKYVDVKTAAAMLGMSVTSLYAKLEEAPFKNLLFDNGTSKRLFVLDALENFIRQRQG
jgi:hypothetical protein